MLDILPPWSELGGRSRDEYHMIVNNQRVASHPRLNTKSTRSVTASYFHSVGVPRSKDPHLFHVIPLTNSSWRNSGFPLRRMLTACHLHTIFFRPAKHPRRTLLPTRSVENCTTSYRRVLRICTRRRRRLPQAQHHTSTLISTLRDTSRDRRLPFPAHAVHAVVYFRLPCRARRCRDTLGRLRLRRIEERQS